MMILCPPFKSKASSLLDINLGLCLNKGLSDIV